MASIIPGFEYDIFISYRQKDNKGDRWVTEFVKALRTELESTFKEDISIYFDENPYDGLLETHNVDKSLEGKLKCLIFIPIVSQTYCDPNSFAWQHEFCAFNKLAKEDQLGRDIKLANGNVASRILPIRIHDLDTEDKTLLENELDGVLRAIEFISRSAGINRPLTAKDDEVRTSGKILYRDQVNKVANAIKEIIAGLKQVSPKTTGTQATPLSRWNETQPKRHHRRFLGNSSAVLLILLLIGYIIFTFTPLADKIEAKTSNQSIAVLPFTNMSNDPEQEFFSDGITEQIITNLAQLKDLKVIARTSIMQYKKTSKSIAEIGKELDVTHVLEGSVRRAGDRIRVTAQLIAVKDESHMWAEDYNNTYLSDIFRIQDDVSTRIAGSLQNKLMPGERDKLKTQRPVNPEAYEHYLKGEYIHSNYYFVKYLEDDFLKAEKEFQKAISLDSTYALAYAGLSNLYDTHSHNRDGKKYEDLRNLYARKAYALAPRLPYCILVYGYTFNRGDRYTNVDSAYKYMKLAYQMGPNYSLASSEFGGFYTRLGLYHQALTLLTKGIQLNPTFASRHAEKAMNYTSLDSLDQAEELIRKAETLEPKSLPAQYARLWMDLSKNEPKKVEQDIEKFKSINAELTDTRLFEAWLLALKGEKEKALQLDSSVYVYLALGMKDKAIHQFEGGRWNYFDMKSRAISRTLGNDPKYKELLERAREEYEIRVRKYGAIDN